MTGRLKVRRVGTKGALAALVLTLALVVGSLIVFQRDASQASSAVPHRAIKVGSGRLSPRATWAIFLYGKKTFGSCWVIRQRKEGLKGEAAHTSCGFNVPEQSWQLIAKGVSPTGHKSMLFFLTRRKFSRLKVQLVNHGHLREIEFQVGRLNAKESRRARLPLNFGYAGRSFAGAIGCIHRIEALGRNGAVVKKGQVSHSC